ncbi:MAG: hypothetical protein KJ921_01465 [Proteobacteria bacterium]|nr:hypothetical protein [Pseudomonadota bacterium]
MTDIDNSDLSNARASLERVQKFNTATLPQKNRLGDELCFEPAVDPANKIIGLYRKLTLSSLEDFPKTQLDVIVNQANADFATFEKILNYKPSQGVAERDNLINQLNNRYSALFQNIHPMISYSMHKATDFEGLDVKARSVLQQIKDRADDIEKSLAAKTIEADEVLAKIKNIAAEQGVTQQAIYFKNEAEANEKGAVRWLKLTVWAAVILFLFAGAALGAAYLLPPPSGLYAAAQLTVGKILVFGVLSFALYFSAKNYFSQKHNAVINKHRQNALVTYEAIVKAAADSANTDIILNQASSCIFVPQNTGYSALKVSNVPPTTSPMNFLLKQASGE